MVLNGALAGLVGITAGADQMSVMDSTIIGLIAVSLLDLFFFDKAKIDDLLVQSLSTWFVVSGERWLLDCSAISLLLSSYPS